MKRMLDAVLDLEAAVCVAVAKRPMECFKPL